MSGWHSLSGYLYYKQGGVFGKLLPKSRHWYILDEKNCSLVYFKSRDSVKSKEPEGTINLKSAGISLNPNEANQFVIISEGKEHVFTAENHESMMVWLLGLQAKRESFLSKVVLNKSLHRLSQEYAATSGTVTPWSDKSCEASACLSAPEALASDQRWRGDLTRSQTMFPGSTQGPVMTHGQDGFAPSTNTELDRHLERQQRLMRLFADSMDTGMDVYKDPDFYNTEMKHRSWELPSESSIDKGLRRQEMSMDSYGPIGDDVFTDDQMGYRAARNASTDSTLDRDSDYSSMMCGQVAELEQQIITTKCELAVMMNRETCFKTLLEQRDGLIFELDQKIKENEKTKFDKKSLDKKLKESIRQLQNQNRFLNEEVKKLAKLQYENAQYKDLVEAEINQWKRDYVFILQSVITVPSGDVTDGMEVNLYGGINHKERLCDLLEEARLANPGLPTFDSIESSEIHVDKFGFTHRHTDEGLLLHYMAQQLNQHYTHKLEIYEVHQQKWSKILDKTEYSLTKTKELKSLCRKGIPAQYRGEAWRRLVYPNVKDIMEEKGPHYYGHLLNCTYDSQYVGHYRKQISLDLLRTMPYNINFNRKTSEGIQRMREVLEAYCIHSPEIGYCQGMNFIVGMCLLVLTPEDTFWTLIAITERYFGPHYFDQNLSGAQADQEVLKDIMMEKLPDLYHHLDDLDIEISTVTLNWFLALFFDAVPLETLFRIWDCFLLEGPKVLFRFSLAVLKINEQGILMKRDTISIMKHLKCCARLMFDAEMLIKTAFEDLKPFPRRKDVSAKQVVYLNALKEKMRKRILYKRTLTEAELMIKDMGGSVPNSLFVYECAVIAGKDCIWIVSSQQNKTKIMSLNAGDTVMEEIPSSVESRVMCGCCIENEMILIGTLSWHLHAYSVKAKQELWCLRLHESVMSLICLVGNKKNRLFCGLANGTIAILEQIQPKEPIDEPFYIPISHSPATSLLLVEDYLWAGCGPNVYIIHAITLDTLEKFSVSNNSFDHVYNMKWSDLNQGVWITLKGSSFLQLWDVDQLKCKLTFDVKCNKLVQQRKEEHGPLNPSRITSILPFEDGLWVGTGEGYLTMYDIVDQSQARKQSVALSIKSVCSMSGRSSPKAGANLESDRLMEKVNQLYYERLFEERKIASGRKDGQQHQQQNQPQKTETPTGKQSESKKTKAGEKERVGGLPKVKSAPLLDTTADESSNTVHNYPRHQDMHDEHLSAHSAAIISPKRAKGITKQKALDDSHSTDKIRSINVETGSIDVHEWQKRSSSTDTTCTESSITQQHSTTSYDNISLTSSSSIEEHRAHSSIPLYQRLMKLKASRELTENAAGSGMYTIPDHFSYDTISITSTSSVEETRAAIAKVIRSKLEQQQAEKQRLAEAAAKAGKTGTASLTSSTSSGSSMEKDKPRPPPHHHHHRKTTGGTAQQQAPTRIAVRIPKHLLPAGVPIEKLIPDTLYSSSSLSGEDNHRYTPRGSKDSTFSTTASTATTTTTTNGLHGKYSVVIKDENYNDTDGSSTDTKRYYSDPGPMEAVVKETSGANLVYYAQHEINLNQHKEYPLDSDMNANNALGYDSYNDKADLEFNSNIKSDICPQTTDISYGLLNSHFLPPPQVLIDGKPMPAVRNTGIQSTSSNLKMVGNNTNGKPNVVTVSILDQFGSENISTRGREMTDQDHEVEVLVNPFKISPSGSSEDNRQRSEEERGSVSDSSAITDKDRRRRLVKQKSYAEVVAAGSEQLRPLGVSRSFGNTRSGNSISIDDVQSRILSRSFDDRQLEVAARRNSSSLDMGSPPISPIVVTTDDTNTEDTSTTLVDECNSAPENYVEEVFIEHRTEKTTITEDSNTTSTPHGSLSPETPSTNGINAEIQRMSEIYPTTSATMTASITPPDSRVLSNGGNNSGTTSALSCGVGARPKQPTNGGNGWTQAQYPGAVAAESVSMRRRHTSPGELTSLPNLIKGVKQKHEPLTPHLTETFVVGQSMVDAQHYTHDLSTLQEGGSYSEQSESDREGVGGGGGGGGVEAGGYHQNRRFTFPRIAIDNSGVTAPIRPHVMDRQYDFNYIKEAFDTNSEGLITKAVAPCLTPIQELTEMSSAYNSPAEFSDHTGVPLPIGFPATTRNNRSTNSSANNPVRKPLGEIISNNSNHPVQYNTTTAASVQNSSGAPPPMIIGGDTTCFIIEDGNLVTSSTKDIIMKADHNKTALDGVNDDVNEEGDQLPPPLLMFERVTVPNPPHNTPDSFTANDATLFFVEPFWDMGTSSSSPRTDKYERSKPSRNKKGKFSRQSSYNSDQGSPSDAQNLELVLQAKVKIAEQPIRCLNFMWRKEVPMIVSCAGCHGDDEAVLKWRKLENDKLWTNDVITEHQPEIQEPELPAYKKFIKRLSRSSLFS